MSTQIGITAVMFFILTVIMWAMIWRTIAGMWARHGSPEALRKRQALEAEKGELMYRAAAEQAQGIADGYARTAARLRGDQS